MRPLPPVKPLSHLSFQTLLTGVEVFCPKTINIKQYLNTSNYSENTTHFVIKSSQTIQLYIIKVLYKQFRCYHHINKSFFVANLFKLTFSVSVQSHDGNKTPGDVSIIYFSRFLKIFNINFLDPDMKKIIFFVTNHVKINIFRFSSITQLEQDPHTTFLIFYFLHFR